MLRTLIVAFTLLSACHLPSREPAEIGVTAQGWSVITEERDGNVSRFVQISVELAPEIPADRALAVRIAARVAPSLPVDVEKIVVSLDSPDSSALQSTFHLRRGDLDS